MSTILIAEDEERIAAFVEKGLRSAGYTTTRAARGDDALAYLRSGGFDLVLLDVGLPGMDGFAVLRTLRAEGATLPVIMLTARSSVGDTVEPGVQRILDITGLVPVLPVVNGREAAIRAARESNGSGRA